MLATAAKDYPWSWENHYKKVCFAYNTSVHSTTTFIPFYLMFGRKTAVPVDLMHHKAPVTEDGFISLLYLGGFSKKVRSNGSQSSTIKSNMHCIQGSDW